MRKLRGKGYKPGKKEVSRIEAVLDDLSQLPDFPHGSCQASVRAGVERLGYDAVYGTYHTDDGGYHGTFWNKIPGTQVIVDLTAKQFGEDKPNIVLPTDPHYDRYNELTNFRKNIEPIL